MTSFAYGAAVSFMLDIPIKGNKTSGRIETAGMGMASVTHHTIINAATANTLRAIGSSPKGLISNTNKNNTGPLKKDSQLTSVDVDSFSTLKFD